jgi:hypothetical protein
MTAKNDFSNYRAMSQPFESPEEANQALLKFYQIVEDARKECRIMDVHIIVKMNVKQGDEEGCGMASSHYGNTLEGAPMCAYGLGQEQAEFKAALREYTKAA